MTDLQFEANIARDLRHTPERGDGSGGWVIAVRYLVKELAEVRAQLKASQPTPDIDWPFVEKAMNVIAWAAVQAPLLNGYNPQNAVDIVRDVLSTVRRKCRRSPTPRSRSDRR